VDQQRRHDLVHDTVKSARSMLMVMLMVDCRVHVPGLVVLLLSTLRTIMIMREEWWPAHIQTSLLVSSLFYELARTSSRKKWCAELERSKFGHDQIKTKDKLSVLSANLCSGDENETAVSSLVPPHLAPQLKLSYATIAGDGIDRHGHGPWSSACCLCVC